MILAPISRKTGVGYPLNLPKNSQKRSYHSNSINSHLISFVFPHKNDFGSDFEEDWCGISIKFIQKNSQKGAIILTLSKIFPVVNQQNHENWVEYIQVFCPEPQSVSSANIALNVYQNLRIYL